MAKRNSTKKSSESKAPPPPEAKQAQPKAFFPVVGIGASAGGLEALQRLFSSLKTQTNLSFVIVQHLDPIHKSQTAEILSRSTTMPVREIEDGMHLESNHVYVIPPGFKLTLTNGVLNLIQRSQDAMQPMPVDFFFDSLAKNKKSEAIGVILSGTGFDGTLGLTSIKAEGGLTFAQDPASAMHTGMPQSAIKAGAIDFVLPPERIAEELTRLSKHFGNAEDADEASPQALPERDAAALQGIFLLVRNQTHIDFSDYKPSTVNRRIQRQMRVHKLDTLVDYAEYLGSSAEAVKSLCDDMFIHVTEFFRDPDSFISLKESVFPRLLKNKVPGAPIRIWVPGCASGEEAYSLVMSLLDFLGTQAGKIPIQVFATDISERAVQSARAGIYSEQQIHGVSKERLQRFFDETKEGYKVKKAIRDLCVFSRHDVGSNPPFAKIDLISCRNVLIYFSQALQQKVMPIFHYALNPDGCLWLGKAEAPSGFSKLFTLIDKTNKIYSKINTATPMSFRFPIGRHLPENSDVAKKDSNHISTVMDAQKEFDRVVLSRYAPAGVVINSDLEILQVRGRTGFFLEFPAGQPSYNLLKALRPELLPAVRMMLQTSIKENTPSRKEGLNYEHGDQHGKVNIEVVPANPAATPKERQFFIFFEEGSGVQKKGSPKKTGLGKQKPGKKTADSSETYIHQLLEELDSTREYQQSLAEGYDSAQEELTSANEELQSTNEELQSTNEEMETAKEELQAANEELTTINDELNNRNSELSELNVDLAHEKLYVQLFETITLTANEAATPDEALQIFIDRICAHEKWAIGHAFSLTESGEWKSTEIWHLDDPVKFGEFCKATERLTRTAKSRTIALALASRKPVMVPNFANDSRFPRNEIAAKLGLKSAFVLPVQIGEATSVIIEFFAVDVRESDRRLIEVMAYMIPQLGRTIERMRAVEAMIKEEAQKSAILTTALDCIIYMDQAGMIREFNPAAELTFGYSRGEVIGREMAEVIIPPQMREAHRKGLAHFRSSGQEKIIGKRLELTAIRRDGTEFPIELAISRIPGGPPLFAGFIRDITERKRAEEILKRSHDELEKIVHERTEKLKESEQRFRQMIEGVKDYAIFRLDTSGKVATWNEGARHLKGYGPHEIIGKHFSVFYGEADRKNGKPSWGLEKAISAGRYEDEGWRVRKDGTKFWANVLITPISDEKGTLLGFSKITRDLTERKTAEEKVRMARDGLERTVEERTRELQQALNMRDEFLSIASHELKTPLTSLKLQLQLSERKLNRETNQVPPVEQLAQSYAMALRQVNSLTELVDDLLDTSRIQTGHFTLSVDKLDLSELTREVITGFNEQLKAAKCPVELDLGKDIIGSWDRHRLEQVVVNLISNAVKYAPKNPIHISTRRSEDTAKLVVQDFGPGIEKEKQSKIFERFERLTPASNAGGLGLGLFIVRRIVDAHQGTIHVESEVGKGSKFIVELPINPNLPPDEIEGKKHDAK